MGMVTGKMGMVRAGSRGPRWIWLVGVLTPHYSFNSICLWFSSSPENCSGG